MNYVLSPDGSIVYRLIPSITNPSSFIQNISSNGFDAALIKSPFTITFGNQGSVSITSDSAGLNSISPDITTGGDDFGAIYNLGTALGPNQMLEWIQIIFGNQPGLPGLANPYYDNASNPSVPFYLPEDNRELPGPTASEAFGDFSGANVAGVNAAIKANGMPLYFFADLYPVIWNTSTNVITIENGVSYGWMAENAMVGTDSGVFANPSPSSATIAGIGTNEISTGLPVTDRTADAGATIVSFTPAISGFNTTPNTPIDLGTIAFFPELNTSGADSVDLDISMKLTNVPEADFTLVVPLALTFTPNPNDPLFSEVETLVFGTYGVSLNAIPGGKVTAELYATLSTNGGSSISGSPGGITYIDADSSSSDTSDSNPSYTLTNIDLRNPSAGGFVSTLTINGTTGGQIVSDVGTISPFAGVTVIDSESGLNQTLTVTLSNAANGNLSNLGGGTYDASTGTYTVSGTTGAVASALDGLVFTPAAQAETTTFTITDTDADGVVDENTATSVIAEGPPTIANVTSGAVEKSQTTVIGTVTPSATGDTLTLEETAGAGALSLGPVQANGTQQVIYTAPASISSSTTDDVSYEVTDKQTGLSATGTADVQLDSGPSIKLLPFVIAGAKKAVTIAISTPGLPTDTLSVVVVKAPPSGSLSLQGTSVEYTPGSGGSLAPVTFSFELKDQLGGVTPVSTVIIAGGLINNITGSASGDTDVSLGSSLLNKVTLAGSGNVVDAGFGADSVTGGVSDNTIVLGSGLDGVTLSGSNNTVTLGDGLDSVKIGGGGNTVTLGNGADSVTVGGSGNQIKLGNGIDVVHGGSDDTISLTNTGLTLYGNSEMVFMGGGNATVNDFSTGLDLKVGPTSGNDTLAHFASDPSGIIDLIGGIGGFKTTAQVVSALKSDGHGGTLLSFGHASSLDFEGIVPTKLAAGKFAIG